MRKLVHPAEYGVIKKTLVPLLVDLHATFDFPLLVDPMAGKGTIFEDLEKAGIPKRHMYGVEIEPAYAYNNDYVIVGDALRSFDEGEISVAFFSPPYGNRMADVFIWREDKKGTRDTYYHRLLDYDKDYRPHMHGNSAFMAWGSRYKAFHTALLSTLYLNTEDGGVVILNVSDHIRNKERVHVCQWYLETILKMGWCVIGAQLVDTPRNRRGANRELRVDYEVVLGLYKEQTSKETLDVLSKHLPLDPQEAVNA